MSVPMLLSLSVTGIGFIGADVGGFFHNPDAKLLVRWYQAAAYQPFFREHAHIDTARREPWLFGEDNTRLIRQAIEQRYSYLPYWYTLFYKQEKQGTPPMLPLWANFPKDKKTFKTEDSFMVGMYQIRLGNELYF
jgi:alpha-glucosidase (family GH31 glycosyl hydrolase)